MDLIPSLGIDRELGIQLSIRHFPSGTQAMEDMQNGNAEFAGFAFAVAAKLVAKGSDLVAIAPLSGKTPPYAVVVRQDLRGPIRTLSDLKGRSVGVSVGSFKWIKQPLRIRSFYGRNENAVRVQIGSAICAYLMVAIVRKQFDRQKNLNEILQTVSVTIFEQTPLAELLASTLSLQEPIVGEPHSQNSFWPNE